MNPYPGNNSVIIMDNARIHHDNELVEPLKSLKSKYKSLFPCCLLCQNAGKDIFVRGEIKTTNTRTAKKRKI
jgi:hypothetical protein